MFAKFARPLAEAGTRWLQEPGCEVRSRKLKRNFWKLSVMRSATEIDGVLLVDKAPGMTSHDVVAIARRALGTKKVGHCGTLDPLATGLLLITIGRGTKIQDLLMSEDKEYSGTIRLGIATDSQDADGKVTETQPVPDFSREQIEAAFAKFRGDLYQ